MVGDAEVTQVGLAMVRIAAGQEVVPCEGLNGVEFEDAFAGDDTTGVVSDPDAGALGDDGAGFECQGKLRHPADIILEACAYACARWSCAVPWLPDDEGARARMRRMLCLMLC